MKIIVVTLLLLVASYGTLFSVENEECLSCHGEKVEGIPLADLRFKDSIHKDNPCTSCHSDVQQIPHAPNLSRVACGTCHADVESTYNNSVHGLAHSAGIKEAPLCTGCHGEHTIRSPSDPTSTVWKGAITKTCAQCHASEKIIAKFGLPADRIETFKNSYHGLAGRIGALEVANCASCHGWHNILPSSDIVSSVHPQNLGKTCGQCHVGARIHLAQGKIHGGDKEETYFLLRWVRIFYFVLIPLVLGGMFLLVFSDYLKKIVSNKHWVVPSQDIEILRMNINERLQHAFLVGTFFILAYSGFSLKFPEAWWAAPFHWGGGEWLRKGVHRWTALAFAVVAIYHCIYMLVSRRGRFILRRRLFPRLKDLSAPFIHFLSNVGIFPARTLNYPSYIERAEYWALLWGSLIMIATGSLLVFNNLTLKYLPLWVTNLATMVHFYEAVLATFSILIWHFYWTIFDPEVYPMNWAWLTGKLKRGKAS